MSNLEPAILDCKVYVRRFLIKHQSPLGDISLSPHGRNVVFVPVHSPETSHGIVALRLFRGPSASNELERDVGFTYMKDLVEHFEKYEELGVSTEPYCQYAHGVVLKEGGSDGFSYRRGDKLWLFDKLASQLKDGGILAPVVNLRTSEYGFINITDVCWYPDVSGPGDDLWTVLGPFREIRGKKAGTSIHTVYRVNQPVSLERQAFGQVRIDGGSMDKTERKALYLQKMQVMCGYQQSIGRPFLLPKTLSPPVPAATTSPPVKSSRRKRTAKKKNVGLEDKFETICLNETLPTPDFTKMQSVFSVTQQWTGNATLASSQADNPQISLFGLDNSEHGLRMDNTYWTPIGSPDPPNSSVGAINLDPTPCFDWPVPPDLDLYADCGGVRILESPENLADTLRKRSLDRSRWPYRPYGSFSTDSFSGFSSTTTVPAWWGSNIIIARRGFNKTADGQIEIETGEAITEVERIAATDITQEHFWRGRNSQGIFGEFPSWVSGHDARDSLPFQRGPKYDLATLFPGRCLETRPHRHCITYTYPTPGVRGGCILGGPPRSGIPHLCCVWSAKDWRKSGVPINVEPDFDAGKARECAWWTAFNYDRSVHAEERPAPHPTNEVPCVMKKLTGADW